jgi:hypothetical protein
MYSQPFLAAGIEADAALKAQYAAENSARQLLVLYDDGLLPAERVPEEVHRLIARREAEERSRRADRARAAALRFNPSTISRWSRSDPPGGLPTPNRTRVNSRLCRWALTDRRPLWPARPPPPLALTRPGGRAR